MRIVHAASGREWRGGQRQTWLLARELQRAGVEQLLVTKRDSELARRAKADGVPVREVSWSAGLDPRAWWALRQEARRAPSILHAHDGHAVTLARWASTSTSPWIATRRNATPLRDPAGWRSAARVVAISEAVRLQLIRDRIPHTHIVVVPSGIDLAATRATVPDDLRKWAGIGPGGALIVTIAAATEEKGVVTALGASGHLAAGGLDHHWVFVGDGPLRERLRDVAIRAGIDRTFHLPGHHPDPARLLRGADLFVLPSRHEGLGTVVLDAMALDVPVVATNTGGLTELIGGGAGLLFDPQDEMSLIPAIQRMLADPELRRRSVAAGRERVERYTTAAMAAGMRSVYDSVRANR
jgi:glycosyltransferase involved in cell wall biosynthesis